MSVAAEIPATLAASADRTDLWLPLLRRLTSEIDTWTIWKCADPAFTGTEDVDAAAPVKDWPRIEKIFREWADTSGFDMVVCRHIPHTLNLFALVEDGRSLLQLEIKDRTSFRGAVLFRARDLLPLSHIDPRGFRTLRPGAEGVVKLTLHGLRHRGRPNHKALAEHGVIEMLREDPEAAVAATALYGPARRHVLRAVRAAVEGKWDRKAMLLVEASAALRAVVQPQVGARRWWFRRVTRQRCPVLQTVYADHRRITGDRAHWLAEARRDHVVVSSEPASPMPGRFVVLVGPDGVGKTTVARELLDRFDGPGHYVYFRPPLSGRLPSRPPTGPRPRGDKNPPQQAAILGWLRLIKNLFWFWIGYLRVVRPAVRAGKLVVGDRWAYGYMVQPGPLAFFGPGWLARVGVRLMPHPDVVINLTASPDVIVARKDELTEVQAAAELALWPTLPVPRIETVDAAGSAAEVVASIVDRLQACSGSLNGKRP